MQLGTLDAAKVCMYCVCEINKWELTQWGEYNLKVAVNPKTTNFI